jgi:hypothetical protein
VQRFIIVYDAARALSNMIVRVSGYRPKRLGDHNNTFLAVEASDPCLCTARELFNTCRRMRHDSEYDFAGSITRTQAEELIP